LDWGQWVGLKPAGLVNETSLNLASKPGWQRLKADDLRRMAAQALRVPMEEVRFFYRDEDLLIEPTAFTRLAADRIATANTHGTGCTLSSAIAAGLAKGLSLAEAVRAAKTYVTDALAAANRIKIGSGHGPVHHFHAWW